MSSALTKHFEMMAEDVKNDIQNISKNVLRQLNNAVFELGCAEAMILKAKKDAWRMDVAKPAQTYLAEADTRITESTNRAKAAIESMNNFTKKFIETERRQ